MRSTIVKTSLGVSTSVLAVSGGLTVIPLAPVLILAGLVGGTVIAVSAINSGKSSTSGKRAGKQAPAKIQTAKGGDHFRIQCLGGGFCNVELDSDCRITSGHPNAHGSTCIEILKVSDGRFAFKAPNQKFISADRNRGGMLVADRDSIDEWELFTIEEHTGAYVALKASNGKYVTRCPDSVGTLKANASTPGKDGLFQTMINSEQVAMKDPIVVTKKIIIEKTIEVKIDILDYEEAVKMEKGWFFGRLVNWLAPEKARQMVKERVEKEIEDKLKARVEEQIDIKLSALLCDEVSQKINAELASSAVGAAVVTRFV